MKLEEKLKQINACDEAISWASGKDFKTAWAECPRGDWMLWLMKKGNICDLRTITFAKAECANLVRHLMKDGRSIAALDAAFAFSRGEISAEELAYAAYAAAAGAVKKKMQILSQCADICRRILPNPEF